MVGGTGAVGDTAPVEGTDAVAASVGADVVGTRVGTGSAAARDAQSWKMGQVVNLGERQYSA
ncbi:MAG: hypothetical protein R3C32_11215 [Chloroflexota bacterium]